MNTENAWGRDGLMVIAAFRYCLGRMTYIADDCANWLVGNWQILPENVKAVIKRDLESAFEDDDAARANGDSYKPLGHDCDRQAWERVRRIYQEGRND